MAEISVAPTLTGTTKNIVSVYYAHGVQVQKIGGTRQVPVIGLREGPNYPYAEFAMMHSEVLHRLLPVLRPYLSLSKPLAGVVPAIAVATILADDRDSDYRYELVSQPDEAPLVHVHVQGGTPHPRYVLQILPNWNFRWTDWQGIMSHPRNVLEAYDYLRANLFAAPVAGKQLKEGEDFVALSEETSAPGSEGQ